LGGFRTFAAVSANGGNAQFVTFAKSGFLCFLKVRERPIADLRGPLSERPRPPLMLKFSKYNIALFSLGVAA
jgi:hypothetical protein